MNQKFEKLKTLLKELFQLDLDIGLYRIMHAKSDEVTQFLDRSYSRHPTASLADLSGWLNSNVGQHILRCRDYRNA